MPKMKKRAKGAKASSATIVRSKFRIGNRKSGKSALQMSTEALKEVLNSDVKSKKKFHANARQVLIARGIRLNWQEPLVATSDAGNEGSDMQANTAA